MDDHLTNTILKVNLDFSYIYRLFFIYARNGVNPKNITSIKSYLVYSCTFYWNTRRLQRLSMLQKKSYQKNK